MLLQLLRYHYHPLIITDITGKHHCDQPILGARILSSNYKDWNISRENEVIRGIYAPYQEGYPISSSWLLYFSNFYFLEKIQVDNYLRHRSLIILSRKSTLSTCTTTELDRKWQLSEKISYLPTATVYFAHLY